MRGFLFSLVFVGISTLGYGLEEQKKDITVNPSNEGLSRVNRYYLADLGAIPASEQVVDYLNTLKPDQTYSCLVKTSSATLGYWGGDSQTGAAILYSVRDCDALLRK